MPRSHWIPCEVCGRLTDNVNSDFSMGPFKTRDHAVCTGCETALARKRAAIIHLKNDLFGDGRGYRANLAKEIEVAKADRST